MIIRIELSVYMAFNMVMAFLDETPKAWLAYEKIDIWTSVKLEVSTLWETMPRAWEDKTQTGRKYFQKTHPIKDSILNIQRTLKTQQ